MMVKGVATALTLFMIFTLAGCSDRSLPVSPPESSLADSASVAPPESMSAAVASDVENPALPQTALPPDNDAIIAGLRSVTEACAAVFDITGSGYFDPSHEEYGKMQQKVAALGFPIDAWGYNMQNYEQVVSFYNDAKAGKDAHVTIYSIHNFGVISDTFVAKDNKISCIYATAGFDKKVTQLK